MKKLLSLILTIAMLAALAVPFCTVPVSAASAAPTILPDENWYRADKSELTIGNAAELLAFAHQIASGNTFDGKTIKITADIDVNPGYTGGLDVPTNQWADTYDKAFKGCIDGQGHTISGLFKNTTKANFFGGVFLSA